MTPAEKERRLQELLRATLLAVAPGTPLRLGVEAERAFVIRDYAAPKRRQTIDAVLCQLAAFSPEDLLDPIAFAKVLNHPPAPESLETIVAPKGYRLLSKIPRLPVTRLAESSILERYM